MTGDRHSKRRIDDYLAGDTRSEAALRRHLMQCKRCRDYYDTGVVALRAARGGFHHAGFGELERAARRALAAASAAPRKSTPRPATHGVDVP